jgi:serine/threonine protein kinase
MATGTLPFSDESSGVIFQAILDGTPTPAVRLNPDVPPDLERVIAKCLEKDCNLRYQHASDIRTDLQRLKRRTVEVHFPIHQVRHVTALAEELHHFLAGPCQLCPPGFRLRVLLKSANLVAIEDESTCRSPRLSVLRTGKLFVPSFTVLPFSTRD